MSIDEEPSNILVIGSDRDAALKKGMKYFFLLATWLSCKKHVEDDVIRKLKDLLIGELKRKKFLLDIFGSDARKEVGLMDAFTATEFDIMLDSLYPVWKKREINARVLLKEESTEFYPYFLMNASLDMKTRMIRSVRENVG